MTDYNNTEHNKCKKCKNCKIYHELIKPKKGKPFMLTYCKEGKEAREKTNWLLRGQGEYVGSTEKINIPTFDGDGKKRYHYFHQNFIVNKTNCIDHISGNRTDNRLCNLYECTQAENNQNHHSNDSIFFHNVRKNNGKWKTSYTAYKTVNGKTVVIGTFKTDIEAYGAFIDFCYKHEFKINPHTPAFKLYSAIKSTNSLWNSGVHIL